MMVARTRSKSAGLVVTFTRDGEESETVPASDGHKACGSALDLIAKRKLLQAGDTMLVTCADDDGGLAP